MEFRLFFLKNIRVMRPAWPYYFPSGHITLVSREILNLATKGSKIHIIIEHIEV